jgi:non-heme chloroperoxidase
MPFITVQDGTRLYWREWGQGRPLLFLSSLGMTSRLWDYQFAAFSEQGFRCIGLDRRGHGRSEEPPRGYDHDTLSADVAALIETLDLSDLVLVGHSMGCGEIVRYLTRHGSRRIQSVVMMGPMTPKLLCSEDHSAGAPREAFEALWMQWRRDYPKWISDSLAPFFVPETSPALMQYVAAQMQCSVPVVLACNRTLVEEDFRDEMRRIEVPTLIIHGDRDRSAPIEMTAQLSAQLLPRSELKVYPGAPHGLMYTHMEDLQADVLKFVDGHRHA